jgi:hypothetical protein
MDISTGFQIEQPNIFVPWRITEPELLALGGDGLHHVTRGYYTAPCVSVGGLSCTLGFHFRPRGDGRLVELEFFRRFAMPLADFQRHFESVFGPPTKTEGGNDGFPSLGWWMVRVLSIMCSTVSVQRST